MRSIEIAAYLPIRCREIGELITQQLEVVDNGLVAFLVLWEHTPGTVLLLNVEGGGLPRSLDLPVVAEWGDTMLQAEILKLSTGVVCFTDCINWLALNPFFIVLFGPI